jgi:hypothetical protein
LRCVDHPKTPLTSLFPYQLRLRYFSGPQLYRFLCAYLSRRHSTYHELQPHLSSSHFSFVKQASRRTALKSMIFRVPRIIQVSQDYWLSPLQASYRTTSAFGCACSSRDSQSPRSDSIRCCILVTCSSVCTKSTKILLQRCIRQCIPTSRLSVTDAVNGPCP